MELIDEGDLREYEPLARTVGRALWSPNTSVADPQMVIEALAASVRSAGGLIELGSHVESGTIGRLTVSGQRWDVGHVVNSAGLYADVVGSWYGFCDDYVVLPFKGLYWYGNWPAGRLRRLVYPVPDPRNPFLGVHLTLTPAGRVMVGPTAIPSLWREDYGGLSNARAWEVRSVLRQYPRLPEQPAQRYPRPHPLRGTEVPAPGTHQASPGAGALPGSGRLPRQGPPGVRAQMWSIPERRLEMDFVVRGDEHSTHLLNVVSPGWTSSLAVADHVVTSMESVGAV